MRKKFAEDDLLGRFRLKNNHALRIDFKPTPPEQVEEVKKEMEPLIENLESSEKSQSNLSIDWDSNDIEVPDNMPSDEELKAILFHEPKDDVPPEQNDIFKSQRHQKMLELLAKVESLTQVAEVEETRNEKTQYEKTYDEVTQHEETRDNESLSQPLMEPASKEPQDAVKESTMFNGEEAEMRSGNEQFQSVQSNQTTAQPKGSGTETKEAPKMEPPLKLDVDHEDFQERLIRILNENYSEMGEIRPQNLKSRLIEILNEEYAEEYYDDSETVADSKFEPDTETEASAETEDELETDDAAETKDEGDTSIAAETEFETEAEFEVESGGEVETEAEVETDVETESGLEFESEMDDDTVVSLEDDTDPEQKSDGFQQPVFAVPNLKDESGFLSEDYNHNSPEAGHGGAFAAGNSELPQTEEAVVKRSRERFSHFQYVTSFQEVVESEDEEEAEAVSESGEEATSMESESLSAPLNSPDEDLHDQADEDFEAEPVPDADQSASDTEAGNGIQDAELKKDEHPWLKELREDGSSQDNPAETSDAQAASEPSYSQPAPEPHWTFAGQDEISTAEQTGDQEEVRERGWDRDHRQTQRTVSQEERLFGAEREAAPKGEKPVQETQVAQNGERYMSVEEWSFVFDTLKEQIDYLRKQLEIKDHQLQNKDELIRNFQILLKNEQDKFLKLENKMEDVVLQVEERAAKKGFFSRFRKR